MKLRVLVIILWPQLLVAAAYLVGMPRAEAFPAFQRQFDARYLAKDSKLHETYGGRSSCNVCHIGGSADREYRNDYGQALAKRLHRIDAEALSTENRRRDPAAASAASERIDAALEAVEKLPVDEGGATFGDLIRAGKLPISPATLPPGHAAR